MSDMTTGSHWRITTVAGGHWLVFEHSDYYERQVVTGCHCGFRADLDSDCGWGDSVVDHIYNEGRASSRGQSARPCCGADRGQGHHDDCPEWGDAARAAKPCLIVEPYAWCYNHSTGEGPVYCEPVRG